MLKGFCLFVFIALLATPCYPADVVFGRRVYAAPGRRSYEQIWTLDTGSRRTEQLTHTQRRHAAPACSPDGTRIWFLSGAFGDDLNTELWRLDPRTRAETLAVRFGGFGIDRLLGGNQARAFFTAYEGYVLGLYRWDGHLTKLASVAGAALAWAVAYVSGMFVSASPERALLEVLSEIGLRQPLKEARQLAESTYSLRADVLRALLQHLHQCELPYTCPHGRPTMIQMSYAELEKKFGRKA